MTKKVKPTKRRNHLAKELHLGAYKPKVIPNKKKIIKPFKKDLDHEK